MSRDERFDVNGRTVFITGAARGIGAASAERLHARGANVALVGLEPELLEENAARLGDRAASFEADVTDLDALEGAVRATVERFGAIDVAIANAGIAFTGAALASAAVEQVERTLAVNLLGVWRSNRAVIGQIMQQRGYLLNIASLAAVDAIERGIERRSPRVWAPRWVGATLLLRGLLQPLIERRTLKDTSLLSESMRIAEASGEAQAQDPLLGVAGNALERERV